MAITHAHNVLHWQENLFEDDMPPAWMWPLSEELDDFFEEVMARRKERGGRPNDDETSDMAQNELTRGKKRR